MNQRRKSSSSAKRAALLPRRRVIGSLGAAALLGGCAGLLPQPGPPPQLYRLSPQSTFPEDLEKVQWALLIDKPDSSAGLDVPRIALLPTPVSLQYYAGAAWSDRAPRMIQGLISESFENSGRIEAVGTQTLGLRADFLLKSELREFQVEYFHGPLPVANVRLNVKLVDGATRRILDGESFFARQAATEDSVDAAVLALDEALNKVIKRVVIWTIETGEVRYAAQGDGAS